MDCRKQMMLIIILRGGMTTYLKHMLVFRFLLSFIVVVHQHSQAVPRRWVSLLQPQQPQRCNAPVLRSYKVLLAFGSFFVVVGVK